MSGGQDGRAQSTPPPAFAHLAEDIRARRVYGRVIVAMIAHVAGQERTPGALADAAVESLGLAPLGAGWRPVDRAEARRIAREVLRADLAYHTELMPAAQAEALADRFLAFFGDPSAYLTNSHPVGAARTLAPITGATFDEGIVAVGDDHTGILWVADED